MNEVAWVASGRPFILSTLLLPFTPDPPFPLDSGFWLMRSHLATVYPSVHPLIHLSLCSSAQALSVTCLLCDKPPSVLKMLLLFRRAPELPAAPLLTAHAGEATLWLSFLVPLVATWSSSARLTGLQLPSSSEAGHSSRLGPLLPSLFSRHTLPSLMPCFAGAAQNFGASLTLYTHFKSFE